ncbi:MAG: ankyrin repeat domain-containing protein, partial [bacterium]
MRKPYDKFTFWVIIICSFLLLSYLLYNLSLTKEQKLFRAIKKGNVEKVKSLINDGANVNAEGQMKWTPLHSAVWNNQVEIARLLIRNGADVNAIELDEAEYPLYIAIRKDNFEMVKLLVENGADVNPKGPVISVPLEIAKYGNKRILNYLKQKGATEEHYYREKMLPLFEAAIEGNLNKIKELKEEGVDIDIQHFRTGETPLHAAVENGHFEVVKFLVNSGARINITNSQTT